MHAYVCIYIYILIYNSINVDYVLVNFTVTRKDVVSKNHWVHIRDIKR